MDKKRSDRFKRWRIVSFFLIPLVLFGSIGAYYAHFPVKMHSLVFLLRFHMTGRWASERIRSQGERALPYLVRGLSSNNPRVREWSAGILSHLVMKGIIKEERTPRLIDLLSHSDAHVRANAADALGYIGDEKAVPALVKLLSDSEPLVRSKAAGALGGLKDKRAVPHLINLLSDSDGGVRTSAAGGLGEIGSDEAVAPLMACLNTEPDPYVRANAAGALGKIGSRKVVGPLIACLDEIPKAGTRLKDWRHFQSYVMEALAKITGENFGYPWTAPGTERKEIIQKWLDWWEANRDKYEAGGESATKE